ncbi:SDR family oxidoreductase [Methylovirgula sp. 4M-Z18]|uniref:SDR family oxidoreductase n=1 Tax=Methylovirgula sp. 4M-Z18 TaxID=2293567 RepID=UPI000E2F133F|nr:SDR family oxidoreductase [Methylovirgula sp. 4M-Z18]RFB80495.1 SDR family oxidoreductase [Methylovirgula sp. 4M-Z18]
MGNALSNQTVVVIGGSNGIGAAVATLAQTEGARAIAISRSGAAPGGVVPIVADVSDLLALGKALASIGVIDHLVHTAAARVSTPALPSLDESALQSTFDIKLFGAIHAARLALPHLSERASITFTSGQVSRKYGTGSVTKGAVNAAVDAAGRHLAKELAPRRVNVVSPGVVDTSLWGEAGSETRSSTIERVSAALPVKRVARPEELAAAYLFAMTNGFVTGSVIDVDGGGLL